VDGRRAAAFVRAVRLHEGLRQQDLADRAGLSQRWIAELELGRVEHLSLNAIERICDSLDISVRLDFRWRSGDLDRLVDREHAAIVEHVVRRLRRTGWEVRLEYGFNHYGDRGSVDILAWHAGERVLLIIEVKSRLTDLQDTLASLARKVRIVPNLVSREGWRPARTAHLLVVLGTTANRRVVAQHPYVFDTTFPERARQVLGWLRRPLGALRGLWFVSPTTVGAPARRRRARQRREPLPTP
jgi:transcriptional regulator with XRE-family HTH domain